MTVLDLTWVAAPPWWLLVNALAAFRLTRLWVSDDLPPLPAMRARVERSLNRRWADKLAARREAEGTSKYDFVQLELDYPTHPLLRLFDCYWCAGWWITLAVTAAAVLLPVSVWACIALPLALSAIVGLLGTRD